MTKKNIITKLSPATAARAPKTAMAAATPATTTTRAARLAALRAQLVPIPGLGVGFGWTEFNALLNCREAELAPSLPAFLVNTDATDLAAPGPSGVAAYSRPGQFARHDARRRSGLPIKTPAEVLADISPPVVSTQTKIVILSEPVDVNDLFWRLPLVPYEEPRAGILKKQIQIRSDSPEEVDAYLQKRAGIDRFFTELVTADDKNSNVNARKTLFVDKRIPFVGVVSKDLVSGNSIAKLTFIHSITLNVRAWNAAQDRWNEVHVKIFNTGKFINPGIVPCSVDMFLHVISLVVELLNDALRETRGPDAPPLYIRHDLTAAAGNHFGDPHGLLLLPLIPPAVKEEQNGVKMEQGSLPVPVPVPVPPPQQHACAQCGASPLMVGDSGALECGMCGEVAPLQLDFGPDWKVGGDSAAHEARGNEVPRSGGVVNPTMIESSFALRLSSGGGMPSGAARNAAKWMSWMGGGQSEKSHADELQLLRRIGGVAGLPRAVVATAEQLQFKLRGHPSNRGLTRPMRRMRNLWLACQAHGCPRTVPEMAALFRSDLHTAMRSCALNLEDALPPTDSCLGALYLGPILPGHFVHRFGARMELSGMVVNIALYVATLVARHDVLPGNRPHAVAAAALYYSALCCGLTPSKKDIWLLLDREISEVGIQRCFTKLCYYRLFPAELRNAAHFPLADAVENKCLAAQNLLAGAGRKRRRSGQAEEDEEVGEGEGEEADANSATGGVTGSAAFIGDFVDPASPVKKEAAAVAAAE
jgi:transcription initiation factor TFIIIB Brf1 subunit/transcription initiation factor TFIIB